jgi:hypothetical protein
VLPNRVKQRLISELDKRLDLDIDRILESPKLRLQLSPAELDRQLLELYKNLTEGPSGDVLRIIGGGQEVAMQLLYIKNRAIGKGDSEDPQNFKSLKFGPFAALGDDSDEEKRTASQWVNVVLRRNLPKNEVPIPRKQDKGEKKSKSGMSMSISASPYSSSKSTIPRWSRSNNPCHSSFTSKYSFIGRSPVSSFSLLI